MADNSYISSLREEWRNTKKNNPTLATVAQILPVTGQLASAADYADAMEKGDSSEAAEAAASSIPGVKLLKQGSKVAPAIFRVGKNAVEKAIDPIVQKTKQINRAMNAKQIADGAKQEFDNAWDQAK